MNAQVIHNPQAIHNHDDADLPFGDDPSPTAAAIHAEHAVTRAPFYVGSLNAAQRGVRGTVGVELHLAANGAWLDIGPFRITPREMTRLQRLLGIAAACIGQRPTTTPPAPELTPEAGRGIDLAGLARSVAELSDGGLGEGEGRP